MTTPTSPATRTVWSDLVGQRPTIEVLQHAAAGVGMTHAWLFTGPPGSGRSNVARAFATALQCERRTGCGECEACRLGTNGTHPDITWVKSETSVLYVDDMRDLVLSAAKFPAIGRWQIVVIEDADRLGTPENPRTGNALLKAIEEPTPKTMWLLCAPTVQDVLPTIRSRCRTLTLATPGTRDVAAFLTQQRRHLRDDGRLRRARQPGAHRPRPRARPRRGDPHPPPRGGQHPGPPDVAGLLHDRGDQPRRARQGGDRGDHRRRREARAAGAAGDLRQRAQGHHEPLLPRRPRRAGEAAEAEGQAPRARRDRPRADGPGLGLPRRDRAVRRCARAARQRGAARRRRRSSRARPRPRSCCG